MTRAPMVALLLAGASLALAASSAHGALPQAFGGELRLVAPEPVHTLDPGQSATPFEATLAHATADTLYRLDRNGAVVPVLAATLPELAGSVATITLRPSLLRHGGTELTARSVVATLLRHASAPGASWLLAGLQRGGHARDITEAGPHAVRLRLAGPGVDIARILAAAPLAIATGASARTRPLGTGAFSARLDGQGGAHLRLFRFAAEGAPHLARIRIAPPRPRTDALRAFELGEMDMSFLGGGLYGGGARGPVSSVRPEAIDPVLLVPGGLARAPGTWARVVRAIDRARLRRVGVMPATQLAPDLPAAAVGTPTHDSLPALRFPVSGQAHLRVAQALAAMLDEAGIRVRLDVMPREQFDSVTAAGSYEFRLATVLPPMGGNAAVVGAALVAAGQDREARALVRASNLATDWDAREAARGLRAMVLGRRVAPVWHRDALTGVRFDHLGRLDLAALSYRRAP